MALLATVMLIVLVACTLMPAPAATPETTVEPTPEIIAGPPAETPVPAPASSLTPSELVPRITVEELTGKMESNTNILIVDARPKVEYDAGHIKGAVSAPLSTILEEQWAPPTDKEIIFY